ncbi:hypothetical protein WJX73_003531 [Symbiochloris irregularis]|uniref:Uncharacterized protein n=1 Tax=Symbiochloris irregularis TaxID=706552 RepID=A0AAW1P840_9CHLO
MPNPHSAQLTVVQRRLDAARREKANEEDELQPSNGIIPEEVVEPLPPMLVALVNRLTRWGVISSKGELPHHFSGIVLDLKVLSRRNCPNLHLGDPPATVLAAVSSLMHVRLDNERLTDGLRAALLLTVKSSLEFQ